MVALYVVLGIIVIIIVAAIIYNKYNNDKIKETHRYPCIPQRSDRDGSPLEST